MYIEEEYLEEIRISREFSLLVDWPEPMAQKRKHQRICWDFIMMHRLLQLFCDGISHKVTSGIPITAIVVA